MKTELTTVFEVGDRFTIEYNNGVSVRYVVTELGPKPLTEYLRDQESKKDEE